MAQGAFNYGKVSRPGDEKDAVQFDQTRMAKFRYDGSDFDITSLKDANLQTPPALGSDDSSIHGRYSLYYTLALDLPVNKSCTRYISFADSFFVCSQRWWSLGR